MIKAFVFRAPPFGTVAGARAACVRYVVAIATALGLPKDPHSESDVVRLGVGIHVPIAQIRTRYWCRIRRLADGAAFVLKVDHPLIAPLDGQVLPVPTTFLGRTVPGGGGTVTINLSAGIDVTAEIGSVEDSDP